MKRKMLWTKLENFCRGVGKRPTSESVKKIDQGFDQVELREKSQEDDNGTVQSLPTDASKHPSGPGCPEDVVKQSEPEGENNVVVLSKDTNISRRKKTNKKASPTQTTPLP